MPGPTIKVDPGDHVKIVLHNEMPESTSIHFHGLITPNSMDGTTYVTQDPVKTGDTYTYEWTVQDTPAVGMYHSHHDAVAQVPNGLAGAFIVGSEPVPAGVTVSQEQVMILDDSGVIGYALNGKSFPATAPIVAKQGEWVEVHYMNEGTQIHPMHLHGMPQLVIAKDGIPLATPQRGRHDHGRSRRALHRADPRHRARHVGVALPHPPARRERARHVRHGHGAGGAVTAAVMRGLTS